MRGMDIDMNEMATSLNETFQKFLDSIQGPNIDLATAQAMNFQMQVETTDAVLKLLAHLGQQQAEK